MARPSPRTEGVTEEGETFTKFGTQQLDYIDPKNPALGVKQKDTGKGFKQFTQTWFTSPENPNPFGKPTIPSPTPPPASPSPTCTTCDSDKCQECNAWDVGCELGHMFAGTCTPPIPKTPSPTCTTCDSDKCQECNAWDIGCELGHMFAGTCTPPLIDYTKNGCECEDCKNGVGECSDKCGKCNAWDLGCEATCNITNPISDWFDKNKNYIYLILGVIGVGIFLWLLRPLFSMIGAIKGGSP